VRHVTLGMYQPGTSPFHRMPAGVKLVLLVACGVAIVVVRRWPWAVAAVAGLVVVAYLVAGLGLGFLVRQVRPVWVLLVFTAAMNLLARAWQQAWTVPVSLACLVALAALVTATTRTSDLVDVAVVVAGPARRFGVQPERVGLLLLLGLRCVPLVAGLVDGIREAQIARSGAFSLGAFAAPLVIAALREADVIGEALVARGIDD